MLFLINFANRKRLFITVITLTIQLIISVNELPRDIVKPTTTTVITITIPVTDYRTDITQQSIITDTVTPTTVITTDNTSDTVSSASSLFSTVSSTTDVTSESINFDNITTVEPKSFPFSTSSNDYHFRKVTPVKKFKFAQKFRRQPRLKVRKPGSLF